MANRAAAYEADARHLGEEVEAAHAEIRAEHERHLAAAAELDAIRRSWSWRLLAPLRAALAVLRGRRPPRSGGA